MPARIKAFILAICHWLFPTERESADPVERLADRYFKQQATAVPVRGQNMVILQLRPKPKTAGWRVRHDLLEQLEDVCSNIIDTIRVGPEIAGLYVSMWSMKLFDYVRSIDWRAVGYSTWSAWASTSMVPLVPVPYLIEYDDGAKDDASK
jgi:hypothetical protein